MRRDASSAPTRPRTRRKAAAPTPTATETAPAAATAPAATEDAPAPTRNVGAVESLLSLTLGVLMVVAALVPRSFRQFFLLALGGGLVYRGMTSHCGLYRSLGIDTEKGSLLAQVNEKLMAPPKRRSPSGSQAAR